MERKIAFVFPGQGAQYMGMGKDIYENFSQVRDLFEKAEDILKLNLKELCFEGPQDRLKLTSIAQPAIFLVSIATLEALKIVYSKISPAAAAGLSLGEYTALVATEAICFEDGIKLVYKRGEFMEEASKINPGGMVSLLGLDYHVIIEICKDSGAEIANLNCPGQVVISGNKETLEKAVNLAKDRGVKRVVYLEVSGPFHSSLMAPASKKLSLELKNIEIKTPRIPVVSNVTASFEISPQKIRQNLIEQITRTTRWEDSIRFLIDYGINTFLEIGPGKVLSGLIRRIDNSADVYNIETTQDIKTIEFKLS